MTIECYYNMDRISSLSDDTLINILSFLNTKEAVQTCILSKRWRYTWSFLQVLKFDINDWVPTTEKHEEKVKGESKFEKFVNGVLANRKPICLDVLHYNNYLMKYPSGISLKFLDLAVLLHPRVLSININRVDRLDFTDLFFSSPRLENLCLCIDSEDVISVKPKAVDLPALKVLKLEGINISIDDDFIQKLLLGCPILEFLDLDVSESDISEISSNVLKKLSFKFDESNKLHICCHNLASLLILCRCEIPSLELEYMPVLQDADISLEMDDANYADINILSSLSNVSSLCLGLWGSDFKVALANDISRCIPFNNLKILEFEAWDLNYDKNLVASFLKYSPHLKELRLGLSIHHDERKHEPSQAGLGNMLIRRDYLETVRIEKTVQTLTVKDCNAVVDQVIKFLYTQVKIIRNLSFEVKDNWGNRYLLNWK